MLPSDEVISWTFDVFTWILKGRGGLKKFQTQKLVIATRESLSFPGCKGHDLGLEIFELTRRMAGMQDWPCRLEMVPDSNFNKLLGDYPAVIKTKSAAGTFSWSEDMPEPLIRYKEQELEDPLGLVSTFAHELTHYLYLKIPGKPPGGPKAEEPATDVGAVYLGFGVFLANSAFVYKQGGAGWQSSHKGYLNECTLAFALAIFTELKNIPPESAVAHLKLNPKTYYLEAVADLRKGWRHEMDALRKL